MAHNEYTESIHNRITSFKLSTCFVSEHILYIYIYIYIYIQGVPGGKDLTSGECSLGQTILI